jgi:hypothetical protein
MSRRLARGRDLLRQRLQRQGISLAGTALAVVSIESWATAAVPESLARPTVQAALQFAAGQAVAVSPSALALADGLLRSMALARWQSAILLLILLTAGAGVGVLVQRLLDKPAPLATVENWADAIDRRVQDLQPQPEDRRFDRIGWARDIPHALELARQQGRAVFLFVHEGRIATGRCGGSAFNLRANALADERVITLLNRHFVPVYASSDDYAPEGSASAESKQERTRVYHEAFAAKIYAGQDSIYLLTSAGKPFDSLSISTARVPANLAERLEQIAQRLAIPPGEPACPPAPQSLPPRAEPGSLVLHLTARVDHRKPWGEFPAENWFVLSPAEMDLMLPPAGAAPGAVWEVDRGVAERLLTCFYPQTENNDLSSNRIDLLELRATIVKSAGSLTRARLDGRLTMKHKFYPEPEDNRFVEAVLTGYLDFDVSGRRIHALRLVTDQARYGSDTFAVALRSLP